jgi:predicted regulator of Ras-like GTPase activity (Roadblock/LC7/MglB family)
MEEYSPGFRRLMQALRQIIANDPNIEGLILIRDDGFHIVSLLPWDIDKTILAAISASLVALDSSASSLRTANGRGKQDSFAQVFIKAQFGQVFVIRINEEALLGVLCKPETKLGLIFTSFSPLGGVPFGGFDLTPGPSSPTPDPIFPWRPPGTLSAHAKPEDDEE